MKVHCNTANQESAFIAQVWRESQKKRWENVYLQIKTIKINMGTLPDINLVQSAYALCSVDCRVCNIGIPMLSCSSIFEWSFFSVALSINDKINKRQWSFDWWPKTHPKNTLFFQAQAATSSITIWYYVQHCCVQHNKYYLFYWQHCLTMHQSNNINDAMNDAIMVINHQQKKNCFIEYSF